MSRGDFVVGGRNFGLGSSREHAPRIIKLAGVGAVLAQSFARIFFRNAINVGLPVLQCDTSGIEQGDELAVDLTAGEVRNVTKGVVVPFVPLPEVMVTILNDGGLVEHVKRHGGFALPGA
jgi:3-isopropylmalate/(R)-2-methylmalate dehydratase small subunit